MSEIQAIGACLTVLFVLLVKMRVETLRNARLAERKKDKAVKR